MSRLKKKRFNFSKFTLMVLVFPFILILGIVLVSSSEDEGFLLFLKRNNKLPVRVLNYATHNIEAESEQDVENVGATDGTGLNLLLIDKLEEGYIKELLSLYRESSQGGMDNAKYHLGVNELLGQQVNETGFYPGTQLPKSYLPCKNGKVVWGEAYNGVSADNMKLYKIDSSIRGKLPGNGIDGPAGYSVFQYENPKSVKKSKKDGAGNSGRKSGDVYFLPDVVATNNLNVSDSIKNNFGTVSPVGTQLSAVSSINHNRGGSALANTAFGIGYSHRGNSSTYVNYSKEDSSKYLQYTTFLSTLYSKYSAGNTPNSEMLKSGTGSNYGRWYAVAMAVKFDGYYISSYAYDGIGNDSLRAWNWMFPNEKFNSVSEYKAKAKSSVKNVNEAIKEVTGKSVSTSDTNKVYGTSSDYDDCYYFASTGYKFGYVYHVEKTTSKAYKNKYSDGSTPYVVEGIDIVCCGHQIGCMLLGEAVYANLLKLGGLSSVDPTNPSTYKSSLSSDTFVPGGN